MKFKTRAYRPLHKPGTMNKTELEYSRHLDEMKRVGLILDWKFEVETLKLGPDCRYTPDFRVLRQEKNLIASYGTEGEQQVIIEFHEVKGTRKVKLKGLQYTRPFVEDDALVKVKSAAEQHPFKFIIVWKGLNGKWETREIN
mgnify:CR=1 FL=1